MLNERISVHVFLTYSNNSSIV